MATASAAAAGAGDVPTKLELARSVEHRFAHICRRSQGTFSGRPTLQFPQSRRVSASQGILILHELDAEYIYIIYTRYILQRSIRITGMRPKAPMASMSASWKRLHC